MQKSLTLLIILFLASCHNSSKINNNADISTTDKRVVNALEFLNAYVANCNKGQQISVIDWVNASKLVTTHFKTELKKLEDEAHIKEPITGIDADPIFDAQYYPETGFEFDSLNATSNYVTVRGTDMPKYKLVVKMANENNNWLVDGCGMVNLPENMRLKK